MSQERHQPAPSMTDVRIACVHGLYYSHNLTERDNPNCPSCSGKGWMSAKPGGLPVGCKSCSPVVCRPGPPPDGVVAGGKFYDGGEWVKWCKVHELTKVNAEGVTACYGYGYDNLAWKFRDFFLVNVQPPTPCEFVSRFLGAEKGEG